MEFADEIEACAPFRKKQPNELNPQPNSLSSNYFQKEKSKYINIK